MTVTKKKAGDKLVVSVEGRLDTMTAPRLQDELIPEFELHSYIELDFAELAYISSAGLRVLMTGEKTAKAKGGKMVLVHVPDAVSEIFEMTGFSDILTIE